jgi:Coenzyme PQQ synthesis protein D (PqqD)
MSTDSDSAAQQLTTATAVHVPEHVVFRSFAQETVMLNLQTGTYHGLNSSAGRMLEALQRHPVIGEAAATVAEEYGQDTAIVEVDLRELCQGLLARGLLAVQPGT